MHAELFEPMKPSTPWARLVEAGWKIRHLSHQPGGGIQVWIGRSGGTKEIVHSGKDNEITWSEIEVKAGIEKRAALPKREASPADPRHKEFIEAWHFAYTQHFQNTYTFNGPIDGKALKTFLAANPGKVSHIIQIARSAWDHQDREPYCKACKLSTSVRGFCTSWNEINAELTRDTRSNGNVVSIPYARGV